MITKEEVLQHSFTGTDTEHMMVSANIYMFKGTVTQARDIHDTSLPIPIYRGKYNRVPTNITHQLNAR